MTHSLILSKRALAWGACSRYLNPSLETSRVVSLCAQTGRLSCLPDPTRRPSPRFSARVISAVAGVPFRVYLLSVGLILAPGEGLFHLGKAAYHRLRSQNCWKDDLARSLDAGQIAVRLVVFPMALPLTLAGGYFYGSTLLVATAGFLSRLPTGHLPSILHCICVCSIGVGFGITSATIDALQIYANPEMGAAHLIGGREESFLRSALTLRRYYGYVNAEGGLLENGQRSLLNPIWHHWVEEVALCLMELEEETGIQISCETQGSARSERHIAPLISRILTQPLSSAQANRWIGRLVALDNKRRQIMGRCNVETRHVDWRAETIRVRQAVGGIYKDLPRELAQQLRQAEASGLLDQEIQKLGDGNQIVTQLKESVFKQLDCDATSQALRDTWEQALLNIPALDPKRLSKDSLAALQALGVSFRRHRPVPAASCCKSPSSHSDQPLPCSLPLFNWKFNRHPINEANFDLDELMGSLPAPARNLVAYCLQNPEMDALEADTGHLCALMNPESNDWEKLRPYLPEMGLSSLQRLLILNSPEWRALQPEQDPDLTSLVEGLRAEPCNFSELEGQIQEKFALKAQDLLTKENPDEYVPELAHILSRLQQEKREHQNFSAKEGLKAFTQAKAQHHFAIQSFLCLEARKVAQSSTPTLPFLSPEGRITEPDLARELYSWKTELPQAKEIFQARKEHQEAIRALLQKHPSGNPYFDDRVGQVFATEDEATKTVLDFGKFEMDGEEYRYHPGVYTRDRFMLNRQGLVERVRVPAPKQLAFRFSDLRRILTQWDLHVGRGEAANRAQLEQQLEMFVTQTGRNSEATPWASHARAIADRLDTRDEELSPSVKRRVLKDLAYGLTHSCGPGRLKKLKVAHRALYGFEGFGVEVLGKLEDLKEGVITAIGRDLGFEDRAAAGRGFNDGLDAYHRRQFDADNEGIHFLSGFQKVFGKALGLDQESASADAYQNLLTRYFDTTEKRRDLAARFLQGYSYETVFTMIHDELNDDLFGGQLRDPGRILDFFKGILKTKPGYELPDSKETLKNSPLGAILQAAEIPLMGTVEQLHEAALVEFIQAKFFITLVNDMEMLEYKGISEAGVCFILQELGIISPTRLAIPAS